MPQNKQKKELKTTNKSIFENFDDANLIIQPNRFSTPDKMEVKIT